MEFIGFLFVFVPVLVLLAMLRLCALVLVKLVAKVRPVVCKLADQLRNGICQHCYVPTRHRNVAFNPHVECDAKRECCHSCSAMHVQVVCPPEDHFRPDSVLRYSVEDGQPVMVCTNCDRREVDFGRILRLESPDVNGVALTGFCTPATLTMFSPN